MLLVRAVLANVQSMITFLSKIARLCVSLRSFGFLCNKSVATLTKARTRLKRRKTKEEYPGLREGIEAEGHLGAAKNTLGQGTKEQKLISYHKYCMNLYKSV